jgi:hypothetical protein
MNTSTLDTLQSIAEGVLSFTLFVFGIIFSLLKGMDK